MIKIIPAILTDDINELKEKLALCEEVHLTSPGLIERVQIDIIDGIFADNKTIDPSVLANFDTDLKIDFHLMVDEPVNWVEKCVGLGADRIIGQIERMSSQVEFVGKVTSVGLKVGLAIDLATPVSKLDSLILNDLDVVLVMSVSAGFGGQKFDPSTLLRINELNKVRSRDNMSFAICDDGGITLEWIDDVRREGADEVSIGERIFKGDLKENLEKFKKAAYK
ncbi:hypothetical protein KKB40_02765 [Patescibacteria group bacterium]|nr:hypothetical protein [Patescibacteria group bacterium]